ncbi:MAG: ABC transporter ATP-binding protein [Paracoccaceae bacterium]|nr:ABC transporter ATP-binding protein [Paracoccaceae bacterium]
MSAIALEGIEKSFGATRVLGGVDLDIRAGEFLTLVGPSGCGKSTLLRILAGLEAPDRGRVLIGGAEVTGLRAAARNLAMVFQSYALYPHLTVAENMMTPLKLRDLPRAARLPVLGPLLARDRYRALRAEVDRTARILKIEPLLDRKPGQLSGGQRQRAALGRAMVRNPVAFLMDEPLSNLDAALRVHMRAELSELHRRLGTTFVYVTHDQAEALTMSDRMAVMQDGAILQTGAPEEVYADPDSLDVARFVGSPAINILPGRIDGTGGLGALGTALGRFRTTDAQKVAIGLRPEHLSLAPAGASGFEGAVRHRENLGADVFLHVDVEGIDRPVVLRTTPTETRDLAIGAAVGIDADARAALVFDETGRRLRFEAAELVRIA